MVGADCKQPGEGSTVRSCGAIDATAAVQLAERLRLRVAAVRVSINGRDARVTVSIGIAQQAPGEPWIAALARADAALYLAKQEGRNRVMLSATNHAAPA